MKPEQSVEGKARTMQDDVPAISFVTLTLRQPFVVWLLHDTDANWQQITVSHDKAMWVSTRAS